MSKAVFSLLERTVDAYVPIQGHTRADILLLDDGSAFAMAELTGRPWETRDPRDLIEHHLRLNQTYKQIASDTVIVSVYQCRGLSSPSVYPMGHFRSPFASGLDQAYRNTLLGRTLYRNQTFIGIQIRPERYAGELIGEQIALRQRPVEEPSERRIQRLEDLMALLMTELKPYKPRRLGIRVARRMVFSEIAEAIVLAMTGRWRPIGLTTGRLGAAMFSEQIVIDKETIRYLLPGGVSYGAMFGMRHFPAWTWPGMFGPLLSAPFQCTTFQSFRFISTANAQDIMRRKRYRMLTAEDPAEGQAEALREAANGLGSAEYAFGDYSFSLLAFAADQQALADVATSAWGHLADSGMVVSRESMGLEAAFFSLVPGNARLRPRPGYVSSLNFSAMAPMHAYPTGQREGYRGPPAAVFRTVSGEPFFYHFHVGDVGNTFVCGATGSGKSTLVAFLMAQAQRLGATVVFWDKDRGLKVLCHSLGGTYLELRNPTGLAPLKALTASSEDIGFLTELIRGCILSDGGAPLTPEEDRRLHLGLTVIMSLPAMDRTLGDLRAFLGVDPNSAGARLDKWCAGKELGWVIDNPADVISLEAEVLGFDQTFILDNPLARGPVMATLYHYVDKLIDGRRLLFVIDEFWKSLLDPAFRALVNDKLRTLRKLNSPMILATQSPRDALVSDLRHVIRDQCPSAFYFANARAAWEDFGDAGMGLTRTEYDVVKNLPPGRGQFLLKQGSDSVRAELPLDGMEDFIAVLSGREATTRLFDRIRDQSVGTDIEATLSRFHEARKKETAQ